MQQPGGITTLLSRDMGEYPLRLEYQLRKYFLAGKNEEALASAEKFASEAENSAAGDLQLFKSWLMQVLIVLSHKSWQIGLLTAQVNLTELALELDLATRHETRRIFLRSVKLFQKSMLNHLAGDTLTDQVKRYLQANFHREVRLQDVAEAVQADAADLNQDLNKYLGIGFRECLANIRVNEAKKILATQGMSVAEVAAQVGYRDVAYFIRVFKRETGITPGQFAKDPRLLDPGENEYGKENPQRTLGRELIQKEKEIWFSLLSSDADRAFHSTEDLFMDLAVREESLEMLKSYAVKFVVVLSRKCVRSGVPAEDILNNLMTIVSLAGRLSNWEQVYEFVHAMLDELLRRVDVHCRQDGFRAVETVKAFIRQNYASPIKLEDLAKLTHFSPFHLSRIFTRLAGCSPYEFVTNTRIEAAKLLVCNTELSIEKIAEQVGYQDPSHFMTVFKKRVGESPRKYARQFEPGKAKVQFLQQEYQLSENSAGSMMGQSNRLFSFLAPSVSTKEY